MGALDDLIAQDNKRQQGQLQQLIANDEVRDMPSQDPGDGSDEAPSFIGYDPSSKPAPEPSPWDGLKNIASDVMNPDSPVYQSMRDMRDRDLAANGGVPPYERMAEAEVGNALPGAAKGAGLLRRAGTEALQSMGMNAGDQLAEHMRNPDEDVDLGARARELGFSGLFGGAAGAASKWAGDAAQGVSKWAGEQAAKAKNLVAGQGARDAKAIAAARGVDAIDEAGQLLEKYSPSGITGKSAEQHLAAITPEKEAAGNDLRAMAQQINSQLAPDDLVRAKGALQTGLADEGARVANALPEDQVQYGSAIDALQKRLGNKPDFESFPALIGEKSGLQGFGHSGPGATVPESAQKQAAAFGGGVLKDEVARIVGQQPAPLSSRYDAQNQNFAELAQLEESLRNKAAAEAQGGDMGGILANSVISGGLGAAAGAVAMDDKEKGALGGGLAGFAAGLGLQGGATRTAIRQGLGSRLSDAGGNMLRGLERGAGNVGDYLGSQSTGGFGAAFGERAADKGREQPGANVAVAHQQVLNLLQTDPEKLGGYASMLQDAPGEKSDDAKRAARITNLAAKDPYFREMIRKLEDDQGTGPSGLTFDFGGQ